MGRINVKYPIGTRVQTTGKQKTEGIVTAIFIRGKNRAYEFSYLNDGNPISATVEEVEIEPLSTSHQIGFSKQ